MANASAKAKRVAAAVAAVQAYLELESRREVVPETRLVVVPAPAAAWRTAGRLDIMYGRKLWQSRTKS